MSTELRLGDERQQVVDACQFLSRSGLVVGTAGNVSIRVGDLVVISPSGVDYEAMSARDVGIHDLAGNPVDAVLAPSSELALHLAVYRQSDHTAIVHTHAPASTALSTVTDVVPASHYYSAMFGGAVRVAPYATFGTQQLADNVTEALRDRTAALMGNHGAVLAGQALPKVLNLVPYLEYICDVQLRAMATGAPVRVLGDDEIAEVGRRLASYGQKATRA
ncbi:MULTISPECIES: class II aldolase/adducin family protein [Mycolicibacterium]|uniref:5-deoxy-D-ribulose 1-phosphate aldolase n=1 Tax=Mycolicibacterium mageritense TaxID=53462 RepID=A0AAI8TSC4_MYCME|nr:class II aldolase/adducin family protein [Mycolicibacterium mageritense]MBN3455401.1 class II aldolase/adducin family protein [Mycobacterium sp. DSM 3803]OKH74580.1 fuculose phosphate aldolase [Mycobacterium sp. SWH-M3]TXI65882.1 MAG: class II aldolase/adducin family protein [Mycolicibacterium mageritense]BDY28080.1 5-deoxy-D-ribulose 1-phosphate aldolase [Mycolicibacterium mageritense]GJJ22800.1 class II aldolase [Mycolicibacterium mageritense]